MRDGEYSISAEYDKYEQLLCKDAETEEFIYTKFPDALEYLESYLSNPSTDSGDLHESLELYAFSGLSSFCADKGSLCQTYRERTFSEADNLLRQISDYLDDLDIRALQSVAQ